MSVIRCLASWRPALHAFWLVALSAGMAGAAEWTVSSVRGTVLFLDTDKWQEMSIGQSLPGPTTLRTLGSGRLTMAGEGVAFTLDGSTAVRLDQQVPSPTISHLAGTITFAVIAPYRLIISMPEGAVSTAGGRGRITVGEQGMVIHLDAGSANAVLADGRNLVLSAGETAEFDSNGTAVPSEQANPGKPSDTPGQASSGNNGNAGSANGNRGNGNATGGANGESANSQGKGSGASKEKTNNGKKGD